MNKQRLSFFALFFSSSAFAFHPQAHPSRPHNIPHNMVYDPEALYQVATHAGDAVRLVFLECNGVECHIVDGCKEGDYWNFEGRPATFPDTAGQHHRLEVLMAEMDTTE
ncbi:hypothetical protein FisN_27Hh105 [Fistulifera solaris]|uniref:Uncharacterized protein n=2 Tax=Fistulifera solaris TaxID=1519565 RepID=A0A1Z5KQ48_FISSO|nr:hypothetical protein FisN_27Hh105 [Fistulifera solaris]|eukprot:GAX28245.1 hypothetical protein FisN_27Hh105 [Fistulifera solaris]